MSDLLHQGVRLGVGRLCVLAFLTLGALARLTFWNFIPSRVAPVEVSRCPAIDRQIGMLSRGQTSPVIPPLPRWWL